ncbi:hypothetical protein BDV12DRAFT_166494 [Aspergillus spectabilis]
MAGEEDSNNKQSPSSPSSHQWHEENPMQKLSRFADEQIASMLHSLTGIPTSSTPPQSERWAIFEDERNYRDAQLRQRRDYNDDGKDYGDISSSSRNQESSSTQTNSFPLGPSRPRAENLFDIDKFFDSFFNRFWLDDQASSPFFHPNHRPLFSSLMSADSPAWPVNYLMFSPYSPLHLERQAHYRAHREQGAFSSLMSSISLSSEYGSDEPRWREAFEDLVRLENGEHMLDREPGAIAKPESGREWLQSLVKRGSLGNNWNFSAGSEAQPWSAITLEHSNRTGNDGLYLTRAEKPTSEETSEQMTELDLYDRFLADIDAREREFFGDLHRSPLLRFLLEDRRRGRNGVLPPEKDHNDEDTESWLELVSGGNKHSVPGTTEIRSDTAVKSSTATSPAENSYVITTQVSTERVRLPDGSIQTKTVKTKRFADGREETNESIETVNPPQRDQNSTDQQGSTPDQKPNGWFWKD